MSFNLIDQPWLVVRPVGGGAAVEVSLRQAICEAHLFEDLVVDLPTQKPALLRQVLLPVVVRALGRPENTRAWARWFQAGEFTPQQQDDLHRYLDAQRERFDLFHPRDPFGQVAGLRTVKDETKGSAVLVATAASGNNVPFFASRSDADPLELTPAQAARWLLHAHCWDTAAIKTGVVGDPNVKAGKTTGNPTGPLGQCGVIVPMGRTLFDTLLLNVPSGPALRSDDLPQWERRTPDTRSELSVAGSEWHTREAAGLLDVWTWQSRRVRLIPDTTPDGPWVTRVVLAAGDRLSTTPDVEPHTAWNLTSAGKTGGKNGTSVPRRPRRHPQGKAAWRGLEALLATDRQDRAATATTAGFATSRLINELRARRELMASDYPVQLELLGMVYGTQSAVFEDVYFDSIPLPLTALDTDSRVPGALLEMTAQAEDLAQAVNNLSADLRRAAGAEPIPWDKGHRPGELVLHALDPVVRRVMVGIRTVGEDFDLLERGLTAWEQKAKHITLRVGERVLATVAPSAFTGRTIKQGEKELTYRQATAESNFRARIGQILTRVQSNAAELPAPDLDQARTT
ncbi:type I-E CRISPR-associated protein Cse1/CasA [Saccharopolyspora elongata]|uniref:type I-E CRISPR-associated protein Cse1/CasA n=1 Tax=Saccharopolyspora elongata TaxID=2530387 RepID=UPI001A9DFB31|nr:type I-E CRISPR-associated protein Cse1/CasA [Saccharopolyspora elongata]